MDALTQGNAVNHGCSHMSAIASAVAVAIADCVLPDRIAAIFSLANRTDEFQEQMLS